MYYENKTNFYIRQYGPAAIIVLISLIFISCGIYIAKRSIDNKDILENRANNSSIKTESLLPDELGKLETLEKSKEYKVNSINSDGSIVIKINNKYYNIKLIGIEHSTDYSELVKTMKKDLIGKDIQIAFDLEKENSNGTYTYIYLNDKLYNKQILKNGYATLRAERENISKLDTLLEAQKQARKAELGIWK